MSQQQGSKERRAFQRVEGVRPSRIVMQDGDSLCEVLNLSCAGAQIKTSTPLLPGDKVTVELDNLGSFPGTVIWSEGNRSGVKFKEESMVIWRFLGHCWSNADNLERSTT